MPGKVKVSIETGLFAETLKRAADVSPNSGKDITVYAGVIIEVNCADKTARIRSTDSETFFSSWIPCEVELLAGDMEDQLWRLPAKAFSTIVGSLPSSAGSMVALVKEGTRLQMRSGKTQATFNLIDPDGYPNWDPFADSNLKQIQGLRDAMKRVEWCVAKGSEGMPPKSGIFLGPDMVAAFDGLRFASVQMDLPFEQDHCVPLAVLRTVMANNKVEPEVAISRDGNNFLAQIDEDTQYSSRLYSAKWPPLRTFLDRRDQTHAIEFSRDDFVAMCRRALQMNTSKRVAKLDLFIGGGQIAVFCADTDMGFLGDAMELPGQAQHDNTQIRVVPDYFLDAIQSGDDLITMHYRAGHQYVDQENASRQQKIDSNLRLSLGRNYEAWVMPNTGKART